MDSLRTFALPSLAVAAALVIAGCNRTTPPSPASAQASDSTAPGSANGAASTPMPVSPTGLTNASTANQGNDLSNSTGASGRSNLYQPPSSDNPPPAGPLASGAGSPSAAASQSVSSQSRGTTPPSK
jgi:hypothetical protein